MSHLTELNEEILHNEFVKNYKKKLFKKSKAAEVIKKPKESFRILVTKFNLNLSKLFFIFIFKCCRISNQL
jgi:hypothetical protein